MKVCVLAAMLLGLAVAETGSEWIRGSATFTGVPSVGFCSIGLQ